MTDTQPAPSPPGGKGRPYASSAANSPLTAYDGSINYSFSAKY